MKILLTFFVVNIYQILGDAIIGNGNVVLGINENAALNVPYVGGILGLPAFDPLGINSIGLRTNDGNYASTEPGCLCEGWGVAVPNLATSTYANQASSPGNTNTNPISFTGINGGSTATVVTDSYDGVVRVTHSFEPSSSIYAMKGEVTIKNMGANDFDNTLYRRVMDWDITPTHFSEYVTIIGTDADALFYSSDQGFCSSNPLISCTEIFGGTTNVDFTDSGPGDHGAVFDFDLGPLSPGEEVSFNIFYGVAPGELRALQALGTIGAEVASLGQNSANDETEGLPHTFFFGFAGVGGEVIDNGCETTVEYNVQILIDESGSVGSDGYALSIEFVKNLIEHDISPDAPVSVYEFDDEVDLIYQFSDDQTSRTSVLAALDAASFDFGWTATGTAIEVGIAEWERAITDGDLNDGQRLLFILTDGEPNRGTDPCSLKDELDALDITVILLGVGDFDSTDVDCLAVNSRDSIIEIEDFTDEAFAVLEDAIKEVICPPDEPIVAAPEPLNCKEAQEYCKREYGTQLATIRTDADRAEAISALDAGGYEMGWIGLYSDPVETKWRFRSGDECPSASAYKCVDFWLEAPGGTVNRPRCIGPSEDGHECAVFYKDDNGVNNDVPTNVQIPFLCDTSGITPL